ncbi:cell division protein FtsH [bacterium (Candidatus Torokbacteria) CG09_land_8_20_14_0_10_42_11]|nr:MAG: cell division protein FtsH [bacterium (Candidatus Torokbacteria) CG09_land_8_20_14_0_10_42_11]
MKNIVKNLIIAFVVFLLIAGFFSLSKNPNLNNNVEKVPLTTLAQEIKDGKVKMIEIQEDRLNIELLDNVKQESQKEIGVSLFDSLSGFDVPKDKMEKIEIKVKDLSGTKFWLNTVLPFLLPVLLIGGFIWFMFRGVSRGNRSALSFGESRAREQKPEDQKKHKTAFRDVAGAREAKEELKEIVDFLKNPKKYLAMGARIPKGAMLIGPPGTGKTLLARAVAGEANVPFFHMSGSEFVEMFVGVGASRVRDLFAKAKKSAPAIVFVDEIDAVGRQRGAGLGGSHDEREQTLNQILVEMDGFEQETHVIVIAATNRPDVLDPALLRPGRFDRRIVLDLPDINDRMAILKVHAKGKPLSTDFSLREIAERTPGFSGADLANLVNEGAIAAARQNQKQVKQADFLEAIEKVLLGPERKSHVLNKKEKKITAYHEAGHALVAHILPNADPVHKISIIARGMAAGYTLKLPSEDRKLHSKSEFVDELAVLLAGQIAEKEIFNELTTGASNDLREATKLARRLVMEYGMSDLGPMTFGDREELIFLGRTISENRDYGETVASEIDAAVRQFIQNAQESAIEIIQKNKEKLELVAQTLVEKETIEREEFEKLMEKKD